MNSKEQNISNSNSEWQRFCDYLWFDKRLGFWIDISKMEINDDDFRHLRPKFDLAFNAMDKIESGAIANLSESRKVGHYWLRNTKLSPTVEIQKHLDCEITRLVEFSKSINEGSLKSPSGNKFSNVLWIGIGGSSLGPILLVNALNQPFQDINFHFLDNVDPLGVSEKLSSLGKEIKNTLIVVVSKSGGTLEPQICMEQARYRLEKLGGSWKDQSVAITMKGSKLDNQAIKEQWLNRFDLPDWVGGRTSITSAVGLLAASIIGRDIYKFLEGASLMDEATRKHDIFTNPAALLAASWYISGDAKGRKDMVVLPYQDKLEVFSKYLQQLIMESLGKKINRNSEVVNQGLSVYGNKGSTDQHAYIQQLRDGLDNFFAIFIEVLKDNSVDIDQSNMNPADYLSGFLQGTRQALTEAKKESITISINELNEFSLGSLIALFERSVGLYAELININAYDQPGVEAGKIAAADVIDLKNKIDKILSDGEQRTINSLSLLLGVNKKEQIFWIIRSMYINNLVSLEQGKWSQPTSLAFRITK